MSEDELKCVTLAMLERANELTDNPAVICAALYQGLIAALATHFPGEAHRFVGDLANVAPGHLADAIERGGTKQ